jgi:hypothetical protein
MEIVVLSIAKRRLDMIAVFNLNRPESRFVDFESEMTS